MRYLFFDIECSNGRDICEFGYVITNEKFEVLEKKDITINPEAKFNLTGRKGGRDITLFFDYAVYYSSRKFDKYYQAIKDLIEHPNQIIIGHAIYNDVGFLKNACNRYNLEHINFEFNDSQKIYSEFCGNKKAIALESAAEILDVPKPKFIHKSDEDSQSTMEFIRAITEKLEVGLEELISMCPSCSGKARNGEYEFYHTEKKLASPNFDKKIKEELIYKTILRLLDGVHPERNIIQSKLTGKTICLSINYERSNFKQILSIIQLLANHGCTYKLKASLNDYFVKSNGLNEDGSERYCTREQYVNEAIASGAKIEILPFRELLDILGITKEELDNMPAPKEEMYLIKNKRQNDIRDFGSAHQNTFTIGELIKQ